MNPDRPDWSVRHSLRGTSTLSWSDGRQGEFHCRGGVCWPELILDRCEGFLLIVGQNIHDPARVAVVFEAEPTYGCAPIISPAGIEYPGMAPFFNVAWQAYGCRTHYYRQVPGVHDENMLAIMRSDSIHPKPWFVTAPFDDADHARAIIARWLSAKRLRAAEGGAVLMATTAITHAPRGAPIPPVLRALASVLSGLDRHPWRLDARPYEREPSA